MSESTPQSRMSVRDALQGLADARDDSAIVVTNQGSARVWPLLAQHPLDFHYNPSTMGGAVPLGLGLAIAQPDRHVIIVTGDGALTMSLGSLVSVAAAKTANVTIVVLDNGIYEVTGGQQIASDLAKVDYVALASSVGFSSAREFSDITEWNTSATDMLSMPGPRLVSLVVERAIPEDMQTAAEPIAQQLARLSGTLRANS